MTPGWLRLRASRSNLDTAGALDIDSAKSPETMERVRIQITHQRFISGGSLTGGPNQ